jgi:hypothetical protein
MMRRAPGTWLTPRWRRLLIALALLLWGERLSASDVPLCDGQTYFETSCVPCPPSTGVAWPQVGCIRADYSSCVTGAWTGYGWPNFCYESEPFTPSSNAAQCVHRGQSSGSCGDKKDNNWDGCADEGCTLGTGACACTARCTNFSCSSPPLATCNPYKDIPETCGNGEDDNGGRLQRRWASADRSPHPHGHGMGRVVDLPRG